jgi:murein DD-endopeptidase MepM/ murein hydrolase activator NlpD
LPSEAEEPATPEAEGQTLNASLERPQDSDHEDTSAFESVIAAGESLSEKTTEQTKEVHDEILEERKKAEEREEARKEREGKVWVSPLSDYRVTASFGSRSSLWSSYHPGIDLAADYGTDVRAVSRGEIIFAGWDGAYGKKIAIQHWDGTVTWYGHLSRIAFTSGTVEPGTIIGGVGSTGNSTGPHLHLEVRPADGDPVNPATWLSEQGLDL